MTKPYVEADIFAMLKKRYAEDGGNGPAHVIVPSVRSDAGFSARRTIDAVAMGLWPSRGLHLTGFEIKCSRSDWVREMKNAAKAEEFAGVVDFLYLVTAAPEIVQPGELPHGWGHLTVKGGKLSQMAEPKALHDLTPGKDRRTSFPEHFNRGFLAALLRQAARQGASTPEKIAEAVAIERAYQERLREDGVAGYKQRAEDLQKIIHEFEQASGLRLRDKYAWGGRDPAEIGKAVRMVLDGDSRVGQIEDRLKRLHTTAEGISREIEQHISFYAEG